MEKAAALRKPIKVMAHIPGANRVKMRQRKTWLVFERPSIECYPPTQVRALAFLPGTHYACDPLSSV